MNPAIQYLKNREEALANGQKKYTGSGCTHGHTGQDNRYTRNNECVECTTDQNEKRKSQREKKVHQIEVIGKKGKGRWQV